MEHFGPFDAVGAVMLEIERMAGFQQGQADFAVGKVQAPKDEPLTPCERKRVEGYLDGWMFAQSRFYKRITAKE
jgi:hypothetical protein